MTHWDSRSYSSCIKGRFSHTIVVRAPLVLCIMLLQILHVGVGGGDGTSVLVVFLGTWTQPPAHRGQKIRSLKAGPKNRGNSILTVLTTIQCYKATCWCWSLLISLIGMSLTTIEGSMYEWIFLTILSSNEHSYNIPLSSERNGIKEW